MVFMWKCILPDINYSVDSHIKIDCLFMEDFMFQLQQLWFAAQRAFCPDM